MSTAQVIDFSARLPKPEKAAHTHDVRETFFAFVSTLAADAQEGALLWVGLHTKADKQIDPESPQLKKLAIDALEWAADELRKELADEENMRS